MAGGRSARVFTIAPSVPFLPTLIRALIGGGLVPGFPASDDPLALTTATIYLPTRRACRLARDVFLDTLGRNAALLPRIRPIGDIDEDELAFADAATGAVAEAALDLPPALGPLERRLLLARLVLQWAGSTELHGAGGASLVAHSPAAALRLADDLARLIDDMTTRQVAWDRLDEIVPERFDPYWQLSLRFLKIARDAWPAILHERGAIEAAARRDRLIAAETARLAAATGGPVIAAGSTGSIPATAALLATIARLPHGAVVLPGLDTHLDDATWELIGGHEPGNDTPGPPAYGHPQFAMQALLKGLGVDRSMVAPLAPAAPHGREPLLSEAMRPAAATDRWRERLGGQAGAGALASVTVIEAANADEEALAIAVTLREILEDVHTTAALATPDRALARRVTAALARWQIAVDDSGGDALTDTPAGRFARLIAEAAFGGLPPVTLLALIKHPLFRLGKPEGAHDRAVAALERAILRGPRPRPGSAGIADALARFRQERPTLHRRDPRILIRETDLDEAATLVADLAAALAPLEKLGPQPRRFGEFAAAHRDVLVALATGRARDSAALEGDTLLSAFDDIVARAPGDDLDVAPADYPELFTASIADRVVRRPDRHARVRIFGLLEARLQTVDRMVLGGLVEGTWPPETRTDPWLSRPMRQELGLDLPERRIGLSAHDFAQALGAPEVILTRAAKVAGVPTVASRFVQRLAAVAGETAWNNARARGERYLTWARSLDAPPPTIERITAPQPRPPAHARPTSITVTDVEHWLRDPYTIYAKHVLRLAPLDAIDTPPGARDRGNLIHDAIGDFSKLYAARLPPEPIDELIRFGREHFVPLADYPEAQAFWWPRFLRIARWFAGWDAERRAVLSHMDAEIGGSIDIPLATGSFRLIARADRIEHRGDGCYAIVDYKTGQARTEKQVRTGLAPQLTLESAILRKGGFAGVAAGASIEEILYVTLRGGEPAGEACAIEFQEGTPDSQADRALARFTMLVARFANEQEPFRSLVHPMWRARYGDYDHLARVKEWRAAEDDAGDAA
ncbi:MAG: double-strand break repair protein AddB [Hyphomicrobiales bacterium]|nr:double-strand break repair protein AddB [Hyphomicrobiales bacterium]MBV8825097.1 double-strand break repair protein AddB [Hyphomicrobiales bacterium]MBV9429354.1 double-strand break repair protein AddB [Bradyrhizobiaceae bacterium]